MAEGSPPTPSHSPPPPASGGRRRAPGAYLNLPVWQRLALSLLVAVVLLAAMVAFVNSHNTNSPPSTNPAAAVQANREAEILVAQDQAPHVARLPRGKTSSAGLARVIHAHLARQVAFGSISGPLRSARCHATGSHAGTARAFSCTAESGDVTYPFLAVVDLGTGRATYCKRDPPPTSSDNVPVSRRCRL